MYRQITILPLKETGVLCRTMRWIITRLFAQVTNLRVDVYVFSNKVNRSASTQYTYQQSRNVTSIKRKMLLRRAKKRARDKIRKNKAVPADPGCPVTHH